MLAVALDHVRPDGDGSPLRQRVACVQSEVDDDEADLGGVGNRGRRDDARVRTSSTSSCINGRSIDSTRARTTSASMTVGATSRLRLKARKLAHEPAGVVRRALHLVELGGDDLAEALAQQAGVASHHEQQVVEVVGDSARQAADRLHFPGVRKPPIELLAGGRVGQQDDAPAAEAVDVADGRRVDRRVEGLAVPARARERMVHVRRPRPDQVDQEAVLLTRLDRQPPPDDLGVAPAEERLGRAAPAADAAVGVELDAREGRGLDQGLETLDGADEVGLQEHHQPRGDGQRPCRDQPVHWGHAPATGPQTRRARSTRP